MDSVTGDDDPQVRLVARIRSLLPDGPDACELTMFGELAIMLDDSMLVAVGPAGDLLVRVERARAPELLRRPGAARAVMGTGRVMGPGWVRVSAAVLADDAELALWIAAALERNRAARG